MQSLHDYYYYCNEATDLVNIVLIFVFFMVVMFVGIIHVLVDNEHFNLVS